MSVGSGFIAPRTISGSPVVMPPSRPAGAVGLAVVAALGGVEDLVVGLRARHARDREAVADRDALDRLDRADRHRQAPVEALLPGDVRAEPGHQPERLHLEHAAERLVGLAQLVDLAHHRLRRLRVQAAHRRAVDLREVLGRERSLRARARGPRRSGSRASGPRRRARAGTPCTAPRRPRARRSRERRPARGCCARRDCLYFCVPTRSA